MNPRLEVPSARIVGRTFSDSPGRPVGGSKWVSFESDRQGLIRALDPPLTSHKHHPRLVLDHYGASSAAQGFLFSQARGGPFL